MTYPVIRKKPRLPKLGLREPAVLRSDKHLRWIRRMACAVGRCDSRQIEAAHVRSGLPPGEHAGVGIKPSDNWCLPLCREHHAEQHRLGETTFARSHGLQDLPVLAVRYALQSTDMAIRDKAASMRELV